MRVAADMRIEVTGKVAFVFCKQKSKACKNKKPSYKLGFLAPPEILFTVE